MILILTGYAVNIAICLRIALVDSKKDPTGYKETLAFFALISTVPYLAAAFAAFSLVFAFGRWLYEKVRGR